MFGCLKSLFKKRTADAEDGSSFNPVGSSLIKVHKAAPRPAPDTADEKPLAKPAQQPVAQPKAQRLSLPLEPIVQKLPEALKAALPSLPSPNQLIELELEDLPEQLKRGSVRVTFGKIRKALPSAFTGVHPDFDRLFVNLPIAIIVPQVKLSQRESQVRISVPEEGVAEFDLKGGFGDSVPVVPAPPPEPVPEKKLSLPTLPDIEEVPAPSVPSDPPVSSPAPAFRIAADDSSPLSAPPPEAADEAPEPDLAVVRLAVTEIEDFLSGEEMAEVTGSELESRVIHLPVPALAPMIERGQITVAWADLLQWMRPPGPPGNFPANRVELPLPLIAPRYHEVTKNGGPVPSAPEEVEQPPEIDAGVIDIDLEDLNTDLIDPEPLPEHEIEETAEPASEIVDEHEEWRPESVVARLRHLDGVDGAVIASREGLVVASDVSSHIDSDIFAAFLPEITVRTTVYVTEMNLPAPDLMEISLGEQKLLLIPAGDLFVGLLAARTATVPTGQVKDLAQGLHQFGSIL